MRKEPLKEEHIRRLTDWQITGIDLRDAAGLRFQPGETILRQGMPMDYLLFVISGKVKVCSDAANGKDLLLCYYISEGIIGDVELMTDKRVAGTTINAVTECLCIGLPYSKYADILKNNLLFVNRVGRELALKLLRSSKNSALTALHSGEERLCAHISAVSQDGVFSETLTDAARSIGISYRHLLRILNRLCSAGVLAKKSGDYQIVDNRELNRRAQDFYIK